MNKEERLIERFYSSLQRRDWKGMVQVYHPDIFFYDPVFGNLAGSEVGKMWEMLWSIKERRCFGLRMGRSSSTRMSGVSGGGAGSRWVGRGCCLDGHLCSRVRCAGRRDTVWENL